MVQPTGLDRLNRAALRRVKLNSVNIAAVYLEDDAREQDRVARRRTPPTMTRPPIASALAAPSPSATCAATYATENERKAPPERTQIRHRRIAGVAYRLQPKMGKTDENPKEAEPRQQAQGQVEGKTPTAARESIVQPVHKRKAPPERGRSTATVRFAPLDARARRPR